LPSPLQCQRLAASAQNPGNLHCPDTILQHCFRPRSTGRGGTRVTTTESRNEGLPGCWLTLLDSASNVELHRSHSAILFDIAPFRNVAKKLDGLLMGSLSTLSWDFMFNGADFAQIPFSFR
jgi:hypothetical protein